MLRTANASRILLATLHGSLHAAFFLFHHSTAFHLSKVLQPLRRLRVSPDSALLAVLLQTERELFIYFVD